MKLKRLSALLVSSLLLGFGLFGICSFAAFFNIQKASAYQATSPSFVRIIHASPYVGTADIFVDGSKLLSSFAFGSITDYASIPPGPHKVEIALVGKGIDAAAITETLSVNPGFAYTVAAIGTQPNNLSLAVFVDSNLLSPGTAKLRMYELSPDAGSVTVAAGGTTLLSGISYQNASSYLVVPVGEYTFDVTSPTNGTTLSTSATLNANMVASLFVVGKFNGSPKGELVTALAAGLPGLPKTGSDPNAVPQTDAAQTHPFIPWPWPLGIASMLFIGSWIFIRRVVARRQ